MSDDNRPLIPADNGVKPGKDGKAPYRKACRATLETSLRDPKIETLVKPKMLDGSRKGHKVLDADEILAEVLDHVTPGQKAAIVGQHPFTRWDAVECLIGVVKKYHQLDKHWKLTGEWSKAYQKRLARRPATTEQTTE